MITMHRVSLGFAKFKKAKLMIFTNSVILSLTDNPAYPDLPVSLADLRVASDAYVASLSNALDGGRISTAAQSAARARLVGLLRDEAHYVQIIAKSDLPTLLSSGFTPVNRNNAQSPLLRPWIRKILRPQSTQLRLILKPVPNARSYQVQLKVGEGDWQDGGVHPQARKLVLKNLVPGTMYQIRVRAVGGSTDYSDWSMTNSCMAV